MSITEAFPILRKIRKFFLFVYYEKNIYLTTTPCRIVSLIYWPRHSSFNFDYWREPIQSSIINYKIVPILIFFSWKTHKCHETSCFEMFVNYTVTLKNVIMLFISFSNVSIKKFVFNIKCFSADLLDYVQKQNSGYRIIDDITLFDTIQSLNFPDHLRHSLLIYFFKYPLLLSNIQNNL